jgi:TonB family protein
MVAVLLPFAAITARAQGRGSIAGVVKDPSGSRVPGVRVTAKNLDGSNQEVVVANPAGEYQFASIPSGRYLLEFASPGFVLSKAEATLVSGAVARVDANLAIGGMTESVVVRGQKAAGVVPRTAAAAERIKIGGNVTAARLVRQPKPVYPAELQQAGVQGSVVMSAVVSKNGTLLNPVVRNTVDPRLAEAALAAVRQWVYQPALLNGEPVETLTTITLDFLLEQ